MKSNSNKLAGAGVLSAVAASLCCITPVLALISGASGAASAFSWMDPFRPYLIGITVLVLGFAWYQKLKPRTAREIACACEEDEKPSLLQTKKFLGVVTVFAVLMLVFPYYSRIFYTSTEKEIVVVDEMDIKTTEFKISGMTCASCQEHVDNEVNKLYGIVNSQSSFEDGNAIIEFDVTKTNEVEIENAINSTGYIVIDKKINE
jgi:copper chaperone CopZ